MKTKILLADDEQTFQTTFAKVLDEEGFDVDAFGNGLDAIDAIKKPDTILPSWIFRCPVLMVLRFLKRS